MSVHVAADAAAEILAETARLVANESDLAVDPFASDEELEKDKTIIHDEWLTFH